MKYILVYSYLIFLIYSIGGYLLEVAAYFISTKRIVNRGFLCGPVIPIYGIGALFILFTLMRYYDDPVVVFVFGVIITSALEYFVSFILEKLFHNKWWDYSTKKYNINGRVCLRNSIFFGVLSLVIIYFITPILLQFLGLFKFKTLVIFSIVTAILFILDLIYSIIIAYNLRNRIIIVEELKNEKIALIPVILEKKLKQSISRFKAFPSRLLKAYPYVEREYHNYFEMMRKYREQRKEEKKKKN